MSSPKIQLIDLVREQVLAEGPDIASSRDEWTHQAQYDQACEDYVDGVLNAMSNVELLERMSNVMERVSNALEFRVGKF